MISHNSGAAYAPVLQLFGLAIVALTALAAMGVMLAWIWRVVSRRPEDDFENSSIEQTPDPVVEEAGPPAATPLRAPAPPGS